ncbi:MAG: cytochrome c1 [Alphaproteobacteria bacterium]
MKTLGFSISISIFALLPLFAAGDAPKPPQQQWSFSGMRGTFDRGELQRGFQVYREVCASCHGINLLSFRNLSALGFSDAEIKAIAAEYEVADGPDDAGEMYDRPAEPHDRFVPPFANEKAARASNNGSLPPDLSLITKARFNGPDYLYALLTGYQDQPEGTEVQEGMYYNIYFPGNQIAMKSPLSDGQVEYSDGTTATVAQMSRDVTAFLAWAAEPEMESRKETGLMVLLYMLIFTAFLFISMNRIWARVKEG